MKMEDISERLWPQEEENMIKTNESGLSLCDYLVGQALPAVIDKAMYATTNSEIAKEVYAIVDAIFAERRARHENKV